ncbi:hypothetical protein EJB05_27427, partial [Eragrostis curvula]
LPQGCDPAATGFGGQEDVQGSSALDGDIYGAADLDSSSNAAPPAGILPIDAARAQDGGQGRIIGADAVSAGGDQQTPPAPLAPLAGGSNGVPAVTNPGAANSSAPGAGRRAVPRAPTRRAIVQGPHPQVDPFDKEGYDLTMLFGDDELEADGELGEAVMYAMYCRARSLKVTNKKRDELCDICFFRLGVVFSDEKEKIAGHCKRVHKGEGYPCEKQGCFVRCSSRGEAGLHKLYVHDQRHKDWWRELLKKRGVKLE